MRPSARVIVAAAIIMIAVFGSFILTDDPTIKQFGVGLASAVLLAGLMVVLLAPALLTVFGRHAFWVPRWLGRILPHMDLDGPPPGSAPVTEPVVPVTEQVVVGGGAGRRACRRPECTRRAVDHPGGRARRATGHSHRTVRAPAGHGRQRSTPVHLGRCTSARARARAATTVGVSGVPGRLARAVSVPE